MKCIFLPRAIEVSRIILTRLYKLSLAYFLRAFSPLLYKIIDEKYAVNDINTFAGLAFIVFN